MKTLSKTRYEIQKKVDDYNLTKKVGEISAKKTKILETFIRTKTLV